MGTKATLFGLMVALLGLVVSVVPYTRDLEESVGLDWLFKWRGPRPAPSEVVVVSIDRASSRWFGLPNEPRKWPRAHHAQLVRTLSRMGVRVIAFDVIFREPRDATTDRVLADAIREAGNVILFQYLRREDLQDDHLGIPREPAFAIEKLESPIPELADAAAALAPFPLPKVPAKVRDVWTFKPRAGDAATLPVVAFQQYALADLPKLCRLTDGSLVAADLQMLCGETTRSREAGSAAVAREMRELIKTNPETAATLLRSLEALESPAARTLTHLLTMYQGPDRIFLDFYGPPRSINTVSYYRFFEASQDPSLDLRDKAVFVGFSEQLQPEQKDGFYTVFTQPDGLDVSGVEIAATTFGNLLEGRQVKPFPPWYHYLLVALFGFVAGAILMSLPGAGSVLGAGGLAAAWITLSHYVFARYGLWVPLVAPLLFQLPFALVGTLLWRYLITRRERQKIRQAFGYFLPQQVVDELVNNTENMPSAGELVYGVCLATDAQQYTKLSERMAPEDLRQLMNRYFEKLFRPIKRHGGTVSDVVGDAIMAIWAAGASTHAARENACHAALEITQAVDKFNRLSPNTALPTRIGLHSGEIFIGSLGADDRYEYRAVGDIVNTASRIEGLNKQLGTRVLMSEEVVEGLRSVQARELGSFRLVGKTNPLVIYELVSAAPRSATQQDKLCLEFAAALRAFKERRWPEAAALFDAILARYGEDGPSKFYSQLCARFDADPPPSGWDGVVTLTTK